MKGTVVIGRFPDTYTYLVSSTVPTPFGRHRSFREFDTVHEAITYFLKMVRGGYRGEALDDLPMAIDSWRR